MGIQSQAKGDILWYMYVVVVAEGGSCAESGDFLPDSVRDNLVHERRLAA